MVYNHYPGDRNQYPKGTPSQYPYPKQDFHQFSENQTIVDSRNSATDGQLMATSGLLTCKELNGVLDGYTTTYNFRMLTDPRSNGGSRVGWTDSRVTALATIMRWHSGRPNWAGFHLFARYTTSDDLYVASYRVDGLLTLKKKVAGKYTTLKTKNIGTPTLGEEHVFAFEVEGSNLKFFVDGVLEIEATDTDLTWGTHGVRMDYSDTYVDYLKVTDV